MEAIVKTPNRDCCKRVARTHVKAMAQQIQAHHTAVMVLAQELTTAKAAARDALKLIDAARTPADDILLSEIRALVE